MSANISAQAGQSQITLFEITSNYSDKTVNIARGIIEFNYYESILDNTIRASAILIDTGNRTGEQTGSLLEEKDVNLNVGEFVNVKLVDGNGLELKFAGDNKFRLSITKDVQENVNKVSFTAHMTSTEYHDNPKLDRAVNRRYDGKIDESIRKVLTECLRTQKNIDADSTLNKYNFLGRNQTPFHICTWLASRSIPDIQDSNQNLAGYFFYETSDGYKFKSIDKLFSAKPKAIYIYNEIIESSPPPGYTGKILAHSFDKTLDLKHLMETGALGQTQLRTFDSKPGNKYNESDFNYLNQFNQSNNAGTAPIKYGADQGETTRRFFQTTDHGHNPSGSIPQQLSKSKEEQNYDINGIIRQAMMRYNALYSIKLSVIIAGDFNLKAGDLVHCDFPEVSGNSLKVYSSKKSGIYMISDLCHRITKNGCFTSLNLVRDSIGRKPIQRS